MERFNPIEISILYDELKSKFKRNFPDWKSLTKNILATYFWIKASILYNPNSYRDLIFLRKVAINIKNIDINNLSSFVNLYEPNSYDTQSRYRQFFWQDSETLEEPSKE